MWNSSAIDRGFDIVSPALFPMNETMCTYCGQCVAVCPTAALTEINVIRSLKYKYRGKVVVAQTHLHKGCTWRRIRYGTRTIVTGKMASALREIVLIKYLILTLQQI